MNKVIQGPTTYYGKRFWFPKWFSIWVFGTRFRYLFFHKGVIR